MTTHFVILQDWLRQYVCCNNKLTMDKRHMFHLIPFSHRKMEAWSSLSKLPVLDTFRYENTTKIYRHSLQKSLNPWVKFLMVKNKIGSSKLVLQAVTRLVLIQDLSFDSLFRSSSPTDTIPPSTPCMKLHGQGCSVHISHPPPFTQDTTHYARTTHTLYY